MKKSFGWWIVLFVLACPGFAVRALAQEYPQKPIRFINGPGPDILARLIGEKLTEVWKQPVIVENRLAASGLIAADNVAKAAPDGYTLLLSTAPDTINETLFAKLKQYDLVRDLAPVSFLASVPFFLVVSGSYPANSLADLIRLARANPGKINYASPGSGAPPHLASEMLNSMAGVQIVNVPYKTVPEAVNDLLAGRVQVQFAVSTVGLPLIRAGRLKALAVSTASRFAAMPEVPTVAESYPGFEMIGWYGVQVPAGTPKPIITKLHSEIVKALKMPDVQERIRALGMESVGSSPDEFAAIIKKEIQKWAKVIKDSNIHTN